MDKKNAEVLKKILKHCDAIADYCRLSYPPGF